MEDIYEEYYNIDMDKILEETGVELDYTIERQEINRERRIFRYW